MSPVDLSFAEAHGTGTALGDPIEVNSLRSAVLAGRVGCSVPLSLSSIKANIGHSEPCAGMTGLLKLTFALERALDAPNAQLRKINPHVGTTIRDKSCVERQLAKE